MELPRPSASHRRDLPTFLGLRPRIDGTFLGLRPRFLIFFLHSAISFNRVEVVKAYIFPNQLDQTQGDLFLPNDRMLIDVAIKSEIATTALLLRPGLLLKLAERLKIKKHKRAARLNRVKVVKLSRV